MLQQIIDNITPEIIIACGAMFLLLVGVYASDRKKSSANNLKITSLIFKGSALVLLASFISMVLNHDASVTNLFNGLYILDELSFASKSLIILSSLVIMGITYSRHCVDNPALFETPILMLLSILGMFMMVSANSIISLYIGIELQSLALYVLVAIDRSSVKGSEAAIKYFMLGALSSGILLFGASFIYGFTGGALAYDEIASWLVLQDGQNIGFLIGVICVLIGIFFKLSSAPFHMWAPDVYEGATKPVTAFLATAPKVAAIFALLRILYQALDQIIYDWQQIVVVVAIISMFVGAFGAIRQTNLKRLLAYSAIGHMGYALVGIASGLEIGVSSALTYITLYIIMSAGTFGFISLMKRNGEDVEQIQDLSGHAKNYPAQAALLSALIFSMAGIPPLAGFYGKWVVLGAALEANLLGLSVIAVLTSVVAAYYYIRIIKVMYFDSLEQMYGDISLQAEPLDRVRFNIAYAVFVLAGLFNILFVLNPGSILLYADNVAASVF